MICAAAFVEDDKRPLVIPLSSCVFVFFIGAQVIKSTSRWYLSGMSVSVASIHRLCRLFSSPTPRKSRSPESHSEDADQISCSGACLCLVSSRKDCCLLYRCSLPGRSSKGTVTFKETERVRISRRVQRCHDVVCALIFLKGTSGFKTLRYGENL